MLMHAGDGARMMQMLCIEISENAKPALKKMQSGIAAAKALAQPLKRKYTANRAYAIRHAGPVAMLVHEKAAFHFWTLSPRTPPARKIAVYGLSVVVRRLLAGLAQLMRNEGEGERPEMLTRSLWLFLGAALRELKIEPINHMREREQLQHVVAACIQAAAGAAKETLNPVLVTAIQDLRQPFKEE